jgi:hypothetical protein
MSKLLAAPTARTGWIAAEFTAEECELIARWLSKREGVLAPRLAAFAPEELRPWLANLQIHELSGGRYLCRLSGTTPVREKGSDSTGKHLDEVVSPEVYASAKPMFDRARANGRPLRYRGRIRTPDGSWRGYRRTLLPVRKNGDACDTLLSLLNYEPAALPSSRSSNTILGSWELTENDLRETFSAAA